MRLLMVARRFPPDVRSGSETVFERLYAEARKAHEVQLVCGYVRGREHIPPEALGVDLRDKGPGAAQWALWRAARSAVRSFRPNAILANSIEAPTGPNAICVVHDLNFGRARPGASQPLREGLYRWRTSGFARIVVPSRATRDALLHAGVRSDRIEVIHNGVDLDRFKPVSPPPDRQPDRIELAYPARILPGKAQHLAIDAVARLSGPEKRRVWLRIAGTVADRVYFDQLRVQAYRQPVEMEPDPDDLAPAYQRADLVLFPSVMREGFGYTAIEAMACGKPVVWSDQAAIREATNGIGFPVPPDDAVAVRDQIRAFLADPTPFRAAGTAGRAYVEQWYRWDTVWSAYERLLTAVAT
jgi:glycosyltransferase involved in cell wall biosynthesis